jgi:hypothetical protein
MVGFFIVPDGAPLRSDVPTLHLSTFARIMSNMEHWQGLLNPFPPRLPFGFVFAPRLDLPAPSVYQYIVPAEVMLRRDVRVWWFELEDWHRNRLYGPYWFYVKRAEPLRWPEDR